MLFRSWLHLGSSWLHLGPSCLPKAFPKPPQTTPKPPQTTPTFPPAPQRPPEPKRAKERKSNSNKDGGSGRETPIRNGRQFLCGLNVFARLRSVQMQKVHQKTQFFHFSLGLNWPLFRYRCRCVSSKNGRPSDTYPALSHAILALGGSRWAEVGGGELIDLPTRFQKPW